jgi:hypothetical protein
MPAFAAFLLAFDTARLEEIAGMVDHVQPTSRDAVAPGDVIVVSGILRAHARPTPSPNGPGFGDVFKVRRLLEREGYEQHGISKRKAWIMASSYTWTAPSAEIGIWRISDKALAAAKEGARDAVPMAEFTPSMQSHATNVEVTPPYIKYTSHGELYRLSYQVWDSGRPYSIVAVIDNAGRLAPAELPSWGERIAVFTPGKLSESKIGRKSMILRKVAVLSGVALSSGLFFWFLGRNSEEMTAAGRLAVTALAAAPLATTITTPLIHMPMVLAGLCAGAGLILILVWLILKLLWLLISAFLVMMR